MTENQKANDDRQKYLCDIDFLPCPEKLVFKIHRIGLKNETWVRHGDKT